MMQAESDVKSLPYVFFHPFDIKYTWKNKKLEGIG